MQNPEKSYSERNFLDSLMCLPLFDNLFLKMQAQNIAVVDLYLEQLESKLLKEYIEIEKTPFDSAILVSALSQMWIFALYELLRTWKQIINELLKYDEKISSIRGDPAFKEKKKKLGGPKKTNFYRPIVSEETVDTFYNTFFKKIEGDPLYANSLRKALDIIMPAFRRIADLRITLAKHEVPGTPGIRAYAPGYGRIDMSTGSIYWLIEKKDGESEIISRRNLADSIKELDISIP